MKDYSSETFEAGRPSDGTLKVVRFCLERLYDDQDHVVTDEIVRGLTFEELIGALLKAEDDVACYEAEEEASAEAEAKAAQ